MNILRIFGIVVAVHAVAFLFLMTSPGCSRKPRSNTPSAPVAEAAPAADSSPFSAAPAAPASSPSITFDANAAGGLHFSPTRPNTPAAGALQTEPVSDVTPATTVTVGKGESLWTIAKKHKVSVTELAAFNNLKTGATLRVGQKIVVPTKGAVSPAAAEAAAGMETSKSTAPKNGSEAKAPSEPKSQAKAGNGNYIHHTVKAGETLGVIARKYGVKTGDVAEANNITNPAMLRVGKEILIPAAKAKTTQPTESPKPATSAPAPESTPAPQSSMPVMPVIGDGPSSSTPSSQDPLKPSSAEVPVIRIDDAPAANP